MDALWTETEKKILYRQAKEAGFTNNGMLALFTIVGLDPKTLTREVYEELLPFFNEINAKKFNGYREPIRRSGVIQ